jgi:polysaccharide biosynthesis transport protein
MDARLEIDRQSGAQPREDFLGQTLSESIDWTTGFFRRQYPIFVTIISCCLALGLIYLLTTPPRYTSHAMLLIDSSNLRILQQPQTPVADIPIDLAQVKTQVEILKSEKIGLSVIKQLNLTQDPEFVGPGGGPVARVVGFFAAIGQPSETDATRTALASFLARRSVTEVPGTYVFDIGFTSLSAARSAAIANATAEAYIVDQLEAKYQATKRASGWLQDRIKELRQQASDADRAVLNYKQKNKIISVGANSARGPRLLGEQQLEDLNTQFGTARAAEEEANARLERISDVMQKDVPDATVADSLHSEVITRLRNSYLELAAREGVWSARYGTNHLAVVNLRSQMAELSRAIHDELGRIAESYKSDYEIAKTRAEGLQRELQKSVASSEATDRAKLGLTDLESSAKVYHLIYDNFLQKYMEAIQQQSFPITEARVISAAAPPQRKSSPLTFLVLGVAALVGIILSLGAAILREANDRVFRTARDVESTLHVNCLAVLPDLASPSKLLEAKDRSMKALPLGRPAMATALPALAERTRDDGENTSPLSASQLVTLILTRQASKRTPSCEVSEDRKLRCPREKIMRQVAEDPLSPYAEAIRSIKIAADSIGSGKDSKVVGIISTLPGEGKSTLASNLAELIASSGKRIILLDADLRKPSLTPMLAPQAKAGLLEVLAGQASLNDVIYMNEQTGMSFVPTVIKSRLVQTVEILASAVFEQFIESLRNTYDYIVVDFPPLAPVVDVRATTRVVDSYIYVIEWGKTRKGLVQQQLLAAPGIYDQLLGAVLNKSNLGAMQRYEDHYAHYYGRKYYGRYGSA